MRKASRWIVLAIVVATLTASCDQEGAKPTAPNAARPASTLTNTVSSGTVAHQDTLARISGDVGTASITLPDSEVVNSSLTALRITQNGSGRALYVQGAGPIGGMFTSSAGNALIAISTGANQNSLIAEKAGNGGNALYTYATGNATSGRFDHELGPGTALWAVTFGTGLGLRADNHGTSGGAATFNVSGSANNSSNAVTATTIGTGSAGVFRINNTSNVSAALRAVTNGPSWALLVERTSGGPNATATIRNTSAQSNGTTLEVSNAGGGTALRVTNTGNGAGLVVSTAGGSGLAVIGGAKNAVVGTSSGARALYAEESAEVWFSDYGFGRLTNGRARVSLDRTFAETVSLTSGYHVFVQSYGDAELVVRRRSSGGFDVVRRSGAEDAEFSYRIVAKRRGFDGVRLARAPWADTAVRALR